MTGRPSLTDQTAPYQHAIAAYALGEAYTMTKDERLAPILTQAIGYIVTGMRPDGGWAYGYSLAAKGAKGEEPSDTSVCGWQIQALKAAHLTGLKIDKLDETMEKAMDNFERVFDKKDGSFGYRKPGDHGKNSTLNGVGVLCVLIGSEGKKDKMVREALKNILDTSKLEYRGEHANLYTWYYNTQATFMAQGGAWQKWNRMFQDEIVGAQSPDGHWPPSGGKEVGGLNDEQINGQVYRTTLCALMLEVFYRYLPSSKSTQNPAAGF
jgi:hypothetical protein